MFKNVFCFVYLLKGPCHAMLACCCYSKVIASIYQMTLGWTSDDSRSQSGVWLATHVPYPNTQLNLLLNATMQKSAEGGVRGCSNHSLRRLPDDLQMTKQPTLPDSQMTLKWLSDDSQMTLRWLSDDSQMTLRWLPDEISKHLSHWDDSRMILRQL